MTRNRKSYRTKVVVIATGAKPRKLGLPYEARFTRDDKGVYYFPKHKEAFLGKRSLVIGGGDTVIDATISLLNMANESL